MLKVLLFSWEYPPLSIGGLGRHVHDLARSLNNLGVEVHVVTGSPDRTFCCFIDGVVVHRVKKYPSEPPDFLSSVLQFNFNIVEYCINLVSKIGPFEIVHGHDWLVAHASRIMKRYFRTPLVVTIHATEAGRNHGLHNELQRYINSIEGWMAHEASQVIVCSNFIKRQVMESFKLPSHQVEIIPNGVYFQFNDSPRAEKFVNDNDIVKPGEDVILFLGRLVKEKGIEVLIDAAPFILSVHPLAKFVIAGAGNIEKQLKQKVRSLNLEQKIVFTGFVSDEFRIQLYKNASVAVFPSLYEPFGIVALEAMAAGTPVVASDTGGLSEIIKHGINGLKALPGNANSLASNIIRLLKDKSLVQKITENATREVEIHYNWRKIGLNTLEVYQKVLQEHRNNDYQPQQNFPNNNSYTQSVNIYSDCRYTATD